MGERRYLVRMGFVVTLPDDTEPSKEALLAAAYDTLLGVTPDADIKYAYAKEVAGPTNDPGTELINNTGREPQS